jgi:GT2 family glycosyltransferase
MSQTPASAPRISVVMPTHNRAATLARALDALTHQTLAPDAFELILVADDCVDDTVTRARSLQLPYTLRVLETPEHSRGAAAARNLGVASTTAPLLLFLDDDMEAVPSLIEAHLLAHERQQRAVVLGYFTMPDRGWDSDPFLAGTRAWWSGMFAQMRRPGHRFHFKNLFAGNVSMPRSLFDETGGFDVNFRGKAGEDYELAVRLLRCGARFIFEPRAASVHHDEPTVSRSFRRARAEGRGNVVMLRRHPELYPHFRIHEALQGIKRSAGLRLMWTRPRLTDRLAASAMPLLHLARAMRMRKLYRALYGQVQRISYWSGVRDELATLSQLQRFVQDLPLEPTQASEIEIDLSLGLNEATRLLDEVAVDGVRLRWGQRPIGRIAPVAGAEPLRGRHLREMLPVRFTRILALAIADDAPGDTRHQLPQQLHYPLYQEAS